MFSRTRLNDTWQQDGKQIVILGTPGIGGRIIGIPWLLFGLYFVYNWVIAGMLEYVQAGDYGGLFANLFSWLVILLGVTAIFIVPGWMFVFTRRTVVVDASKGEVETGTDYYIYSRVKSHSLKGFKRILLVQTMSESKNDRGNTKRMIFYDVRLSRGKAKDFLLAGTMQDEGRAEELGKALSQLTRLPFEVQGESETRRED